jgi:single-strand DNA-binding protein
MMGGMCKVFLVGTVGRDPEMRYTASGKAVVNLSVATSTKRQGEEVVSWHRVTLYDKVAEIASQYVRKGSQIGVDGKLSYSTYTDKDGVKKSQTDIIGFELTLLGGKPASQEQDKPRPAAKPAVEDVDEDVPF